jgi:anaerobic selenocysteine-containing dehydrogenase/ferredoxin-NADP reductase
MNLVTDSLDACAAEEIPGYCTLCRSRCGTLNVVKNGVFLGVRPDPLHPTGSSICTKGKAAPELVYSVQRLRYPMRRTRPKGAENPGWERISWDEALDTIAERLSTIRQESGAEAVVFGISTPSGTALSDSVDWIERLVRLYGSPNISSTTEICNWHKDEAHAFTFGCGMPAADFANAGLILLWGHNPTSTWLAQADAIARGRSKGARLLVVDPRPIPLAQQADCWLRVQPGTDAALALGLVRLLILDGGYDHEFVRCWTNAPMLVREDTGHLLRACDLEVGVPSHPVVWDERQQTPRAWDTSAPQAYASIHDCLLDGGVTVKTLDGLVKCQTVWRLLTDAVSDYTPERVADLTGVPPEALENAARLLSTSGPVAYHAWTGIGQSANATQTERALAILYALTGSFDRKGGNRSFAKAPVNSVGGMNLLPRGQSEKALGLAERPLGPPSQGKVTARDTYHAILKGKPYPVRAWVAFGTNHLVTQADTKLAEEAMKALEFHVHCELFETPSARYADILLPVCSPWEREGLRVGFEINERAAAWVQWRAPIVEPQFEARSDLEIVFQLAHRLGLGPYFFDGDTEKAWNHWLEPSGLDLARLRSEKRGMEVSVFNPERRYAAVNPEGRQNGFSTPTGRVEIYSEQLFLHGQAAIPGHWQPPEKNRSFPYFLTTAKSGYYCHSQHRGLSSLRRRALYPTAEVSPLLAQTHHIKDGDWISVFNDRAKARFKAKIVQGLADDVVVAEFGWWQSCQEMGQYEMPIKGEASSNINALVSSDQRDPISGSVPHRATRCGLAREAEDHGNTELIRWEGWASFRLVEKEWLTEDIVRLAFESHDGALLPNFEPGQHLQIRLKAKSGQLLSRAYSLIGSARESGRRTYSIAVKKLIFQDALAQGLTGRVSGYLHQDLELGSNVELTPPGGRFIIPVKSTRPVVMIAAGIGITPFMSLLESMYPKSQNSNFLLYQSYKSPANNPFRVKISDLAKSRGNLKVYTHYTQVEDWPLDIDADEKEVVSGVRFTVDCLPVELLGSRPIFYLCGPSGMIQDVTMGLRSRGVHRFDIFSEAFEAKFTQGASPTAAARIRLDQSALTLDWRPGLGTILDLAEANGVSIRSGCRVGQCENCIVKIVSGRVAYIGAAKPQDDSECMTCQAVPNGDLTLNL